MATKIRISTIKADEAQAAIETAWDVLYSRIVELERIIVEHESEIDELQTKLNLPLRHKFSGWFKGLLGRS